MTSFRLPVRQSPVYDPLVHSNWETRGSGLVAVERGRISSGQVVYERSELIAVRVVPFPRSDFDFITCLPNSRQHQARTHPPCFEFVAACMAGTEIQYFLAHPQDGFGGATRVDVGRLPLMELVQGFRNFLVDLTLALHELDSVFSLSRGGVR